MKRIICTAAEGRFAPLAYDLLQSVRDKATADIAIGLLDVGLTAEQRDKLAPLADHVVAPGWDIVSASPDRKPNPRTGFQAMTARPFLPRHFPGYDLYMWLDADTWVQRWEAVEVFFATARSGAIAIVPEIDRSYTSTYDRGSHRRWSHRSYERAYGVEAARLYGSHPTINAGAFALRGDSPTWGLWAQAFQEGIDRAPDFAIDQLSLNHVIYRGSARYAFLPSTANWLVNKALPKYDPATRTFTEPAPPFAPLGILHLSGDTKFETHAVGSIDGKGGIRTTLRYRRDRTAG
ncbi:MAG TPA: hypothetical protein VGE72_17620 [Azospirillum sp.]